MIVFPESPFIDIYPGSYLAHVKNTYGIRMWFNSKQSSCQCRRCKWGGGSIPGLERLHLRKKWQPTPVLLPGKSHGQRSLVGFSPWDCKELDTTEAIEHPCTQEHFCYIIIPLLWKSYICTNIGKDLIKSYW